MRRGLPTVPRRRTGSAVADLRRFAERLPEVESGTTWDAEAYLVRGKAFVVFRTPRPDALDDDGERLTDVIVLSTPDLETKEALVARRVDAVLHHAALRPLQGRPRARVAPAPARAGRAGGGRGRGLARPCAEAGGVRVPLRSGRGPGVVVRRLPLTGARPVPRPAAGPRPPRRRTDRAGRPRARARRPGPGRGAPAGAPGRRDRAPRHREHLQDLQAQPSRRAQDRPARGRRRRGGRYRDRLPAADRRRDGRDRAGVDGAGCLGGGVPAATALLHLQAAVHGGRRVLPPALPELRGDQPREARCQNRSHTDAARC